MSKFYSIPNDIPTHEPGYYGRSDELSRFKRFASEPKLIAASIMGIPFIVDDEVPNDEVWLRTENGAVQKFKLGNDVK